MRKKKYIFSFMLMIGAFIVVLYGKGFIKEDNIEYNKKIEENQKERKVDLEKEIIIKESTTFQHPKKEQTSVHHVKKQTRKKEDLSNYKDYTKKIMKSMKKEMERAEKYCDEMIALGENQYSVTALAWYFKTFQNNGYMDIKHKKQWENKFQNIPYPEEYGIFVFKGEKTTPEELGNILYGMIGRKMGFSPKLIYQGAGFAAGATGEILNDASHYYGDSKEDYLSVQRGINYVENKEMIEFDISKIPAKVLRLLKKFT